jgi:hypothetical protein
MMGGCGISPADPKNVSFDVTYPVYDPQFAVVPYDVPKFRQILDHSKLHFPENHLIVDYGGFAGYVASNFYADSDGILTFYGDKNDSHHVYRSELRQGPDEWFVGDGYLHKMHGEVKCYPSNEIKTYTWMQIHASHPFSWPLLRLVWLRAYHGTRDHLWAVVMTSLDVNATRVYYDMGARPEGFFPFEVSVINSSMHVRVGTKERDFNVSYWAEKSSYFKAGFYITRHDDLGRGAVQFKELKF